MGQEHPKGDFVQCFGDSLDPAAGATSGSGQMSPWSQTKLLTLASLHKISRHCLLGVILERAEAGLFSPSETNRHEGGGSPVLDCWQTS
jgi:hypothetical protein